MPTIRICGGGILQVVYVSGGKILNHDLEKPVSLKEQVFFCNIPILCNNTSNEGKRIGLKSPM
jgi:hypothetical protein